MIKEAIVVAAGHPREASAVGEHRSIALWAIEPDQRARSGTLMRRQRAAPGRESLTQFFPGAPVPSVSNMAEPRRDLSLRHRGPRPDRLSACAARVSRRTHLVQSTKRGRQVVGLGKRALAGGFPRAIDVEHGPGVSCSIHQSPGLLVVGERASQEISEKKRAQGFDRFLRQRRSQTRER
ncbi:MAG TPA: hypothetical protein VGF67_16180 [Ktedonobacteraceae bacterium]